MRALTKSSASVLLFVACMFVSPGAFAEDTQTGIFDPDFHALEVKVEGYEMYPPVISLGSADRIVVSFDEIADERSYLRYSLVHCDAAWRPSGLVESEFLDGFNQGEVEEYRYSDATTVNYIHYSIVLPNEKMRFTISGNYLLRVYEENDPDETLLQARFSVSENAVKILGEATSRTDIDYNGSHQQLNFMVDVDREPIHNMYTDLKIVVTQNGREDNRKMLTAPQRVSGTAAYYEHLRELIYPAGNEYRRFETVSVTYPGMNVAEIVYSDPFYHMRLYDDVPRAGLPFVYDVTQNGRFKIREYNSVDSDVAADYVVVHFKLDMPPMTGYDIFIEGDLTNRRFSPESRMHYDYTDNSYKASMLLKQGAYNYQYLAVPSGLTQGATAPVEGDFYPTVNEYLIEVYYREPGTRYDRLLGFTTVFSGK